MRNDLQHHIRQPSSIFFLPSSILVNAFFFLFKYGMLVWVWQKSNEVNKYIKNYNEVQMSDFFSLLEINFP